MIRSHYIRTIRKQKSGPAMRRALLWERTGKERPGARDSIRLESLVLKVGLGGIAESLNVRLRD